MTLARTDANGFVKDLSSKAVINTNTDALSGYKKRRKEHAELLAMKDELADLKAKVDQLMRAMNG